MDLVCSVLTSMATQGALFKSIAAFNIITDAALVLLPCTVVLGVQVSGSKRWRIVALFATRILACIATAIQVHYFSILLASPDKTWANINSSMWAQYANPPPIKP